MSGIQRERQFHMTLQPLVEAPSVPEPGCRGHRAVGADACPPPRKTSPAGENIHRQPGGTEAVTVVDVDYLKNSLKSSVRDGTTLVSRHQLRPTCSSNASGTSRRWGAV